MQALSSNMDIKIRKQIFKSIAISYAIVCLLSLIVLGPAGGIIIIYAGLLGVLPAALLCGLIGPSFIEKAGSLGKRKYLILSIVPSGFGAVVGYLISLAAFAGNHNVMVISGLVFGLLLGVIFSVISYKSENA